MSSNIIIRQKTDSDNAAVAELIRDSLNVWYKKNRGFDQVVPTVEAATVYTRVYDELDPGCCIVAEDAANGRLAGSCFYHPRPTHMSLGIMTVSPDYFGQKVSSKILARIVELSHARGQSLRLVSSAMNLDSFSLYNRAGFVPNVMFQDMQVQAFQCPAELPIPHGATVRDASPEDVEEIAALDRELCGTDRGKDFKYFIKNRLGIWGGSVLRDASGALAGAMFSVKDPGSMMIGPGLARTESQALALVLRELQQRFSGKEAPIALVPTSAVEIRKALYAIGARNTETHVAQVLGEGIVPNGIAIPSFMPETA